MMFDILSATAEYAPQLAQIEDRCFTSPWTQKQLEDDIKSPSTVYYIAVCNGEVCGYGGMWRVLDEGSITNIAVLEEHRRKGIASALLKQLLSCGVNYVTLEVRRSNTSAINLYSKHGFKPVGVRRDYYTNPDGSKEDAFLMAWKNIID